MSHVVRDWQLGAVLRYQSGALIGDPDIAEQSHRTSWPEAPRHSATGGAELPESDRTAAVPDHDPNCKCFNPQTTQVLNPAAWTDAPGGTWSTSAPFYNNYRWQRQPAESMSFARNFRIGKEGRYNLQVRARIPEHLQPHLPVGAVAWPTPMLPIGTTTYGAAKGWSSQQFRLWEYCHSQRRRCSAAQRSAHCPV